jgi:hypothetical protein
MKLVEINWSPTDRQLRQFGIICLFALPLVGWFWGGGLTIVGWLGATGLACAFAGLVLPKALKPAFLALMIVATPIGIVIGELAMLLIYAGVFLPIGIVFRCARRDALQLKADRRATTYWRVKSQPGSVTSYYRQS